MNLLFYLLSKEPEVGCLKIPTTIHVVNMLVNMHVWLVILAI